MDTNIVTLRKIFRKEKISIANKYHFFLGVYNGSVKPIDKEASGILFYKYTALKKEIKVMPEFFTDDLKYFITRYNKDINKLLFKLKKITK